MCVILHRIEGKNVELVDLKDAYSSNKDGCGLMYRNGGKVVTEKGMWTEEEMLERVKRLGNREYFLHLRIATHGKINDDNCHPFQVGKNYYYMHNGTLTIDIEDKTRSDTWQFAQFLRTININNRFLDRLSGLIGYNKLAFMSGDTSKRLGNWQSYQDNYWSNLFWQYSFYNDSDDDLRYTSWCNGKKYTDNTYNCKTRYYSYTPVNKPNVIVYPSNLKK